MIAVKLAQDLHDVSVGIGTTKGIARAIETKNELLVFTRSSRILDSRSGFRHVDRESDSDERNETVCMCSEGPRFSGGKSLL